MGGKLSKGLNKRLERGFVVIYPEKPLEGLERKIRNERIVEAFTDVWADILKRQPTLEELYGVEDISKSVK